MKLSSSSECLFPANVSCGNSAVNGNNVAMILVNDVVGLIDAKKRSVAAHFSASIP